jgi:hypothetical protein
MEEKDKERDAKVVVTESTTTSGKGKWWSVVASRFAER